MSGVQKTHEPDGPTAARVAGAVTSSGAKLGASGMRTINYYCLVLASALFVGCGRSTPAPPSGSAVTNAFAFEGTYIDTNYNDCPTVTFRAGRYEGALPANPGGNINGSGSYTVREVGNESWELALKYDGGGGTTVVVRKEGNSILIRDVSYGGETRLTKK